MLYNLDKPSDLLPISTKIIDLQEYKVDNQLAVLSLMDHEFKVPLSYGKVLAQDGSGHEAVVGAVLDRISVEFSRLETEQQITDFSNKFGLLGLGKAAQNIGFLNDKREIHLYIKGFRYEETYFEPLELWRWHIKHVKKLLQLARALSKVHRGMNTEIEENLLYVGDPPYPQHMIDELNRDGFHYKHVYWYDHEFTTIELVRSDYSFQKVAMYVLVNNISSMLKAAINKDPDGFVLDNASTYGFKIQESHSTNYLLAAIYHDLWQMIAKDEPIKTCQYRKCGKPFHAVGRKKYCCDSCRVKDFNFQKLNIS